MRPGAPITRDLLLIGGGHAHAVMLRMWGMAPLPGVRLTLVNPDPTAPYTGMLPGHVAGHYRRDELDIDLVKLARFAGARLVLDRVVGLDPGGRTVQLAGRPDISFDVASVDIGITSGLTEPSADAVWPAKPLGPFADGWSAFVVGVEAGTADPTATVIGGGVGGVELAMAMAWRLKQAAGGKPAQITLVEAGEHLLPNGPASLKDRLESRLAALGVRIITGAEVTCAGRTLKLAGHESFDAGFLVAAAGARPASWLPQTGLALNDGYIRVDGCLRSISHPAVFAVGDAAHMDETPRPKAGVYAVRQGPALYANLRAALSGGRLKRFRPQHDHLKLVSMGDRQAVAEKWGLSLALPGLWRWKDGIDRRFMDRLNQLPTMPSPEVTQGPKAQGVAALEAARPLCGGCGSKVGPSVLHHALAGLSTPVRADVQRGRGDDAAVLSWGADERQVITTDHFRAFTLDPYVLAEVIANHALGDVWAMGADPQVAVASLILPPMSLDKQAVTAREIMAGLQRVLTEAGADLVGGHTSLGAELTVGLTATGLLGERRAIGLDGARPGDRLLLTRPMGVGTVLAAEMRGLAPGRSVAAAFASMRRSSGAASRLLRETAHAMTDVTGFGLAGHLRAMLEQSGVGATLRLSTIPLIEGAVDLAAAGVRSSLFQQNAAGADQIIVAGDLRTDPRFTLLFDPQTAGGLLAIVPGDQAEALLMGLHAICETAWIVGEVTKATDSAPRLTVVDQPADS